ncbi:iron ABC transporter substrate-binding protein [Desulfoluna sp.]|uniref:iron ABC transporter substrate-binding protein n=1 Tax=Desulfoluna sp. TaxID=2045199 RepID=UPI00262623A4|nr:iron ABC transporter substrate-binding protein [Desulfoluna sp.]
MRLFMRQLSGFICFLLLLVAPAQATTQVIDASGREHKFSTEITRFICSGSGCLRLATYLQAQDRVVAVDDIETRRARFDSRPYALANPSFKTRPLFGGFRGRDNPEKILGLSSQPQVIFKTYPDSGTNPVMLEAKTGIPVVVLQYGDLYRNRGDFFRALTIMGAVLERQERAKEVIAFFEKEIADLEARTQGIAPAGRRSCFVGGIAFRGPHGFASTEPMYPPFQFVHAMNIACPRPGEAQLRQTLFSKEQLLTRDPDVLFLDLSTLQMGKGQGGLHELMNDPIYQELTAVKTGQVFGVLPYNWYTQNMGSILADAWFIGKTLYPDRFKGIDPGKKADEIYSFLVSAPVFGPMNQAFGNLAFKAVPLAGEGH